MDDGQKGVLVVEDDERTAAFLADNLRADGFRVAVAAEAGRGVRAVLRRTAGRPASGALVVGELALDPSSREVRVGDKPVALSAKEFALLHALAREPSRVFTKAELLRDVWGYLSLGATRTVDA